MSSIYTLVTRCRPIGNRLLNWRYCQHISGLAQNHHSAIQRFAAVRHITTISPVNTVNRPVIAAETPSPTVASKLQANHETWSKKIARSLLDHRVTVPFCSFGQLKSVVDSALSANNALTLMESCGRLLDRSTDEKLILVNRIWEFVRRHTPNTSLPYVVLIDSYRRCGMTIDDPHAFVAKIDAPQTSEIYEEVMQLMSRNNSSIEAAEELLRYMQTNKIPITDRSYNALIVGRAKHTKSMDNCNAILAEMKDKGVASTSNTNVALIEANIECGDEQKALELLRQCNGLNSIQLYDIIRLAARKCTNANQLVPYALHSLPEPIQSAMLISNELNNICLELLYVGNETEYIDPYETILRHLPQPTYTAQVAYEDYGYLVAEEMLNLNVPLARVYEFCHQLINTGRNTRAIHTCCRIALGNKLPQANELLEMLAIKEPLRTHYFWPLFATATSEPDVLSIIKLSIDTKTDLDAVTYHRHVFPKLRHTMNDSLIGLKTIEQFGVKKQPLHTAAIAYLLHQRRPQEALTVASTFDSRINAAYLTEIFVEFIVRNHEFFVQNNKTIVSLMRTVQAKTTDKHYDFIGDVLLDVAYSSNEKRTNFPNTVQLINGLTSLKNSKISAANAEALIKCMEKFRGVRAANEPKIRALIDSKQFPLVVRDGEEGLVDRYSDAIVDDLEEQLIELEAKNMNTRGVLRRLLLQCIKEHQFERALPIYQKCLDVKLEMSSAMLSASMYMMTHTSNDTEALRLLRLLQSTNPNFRVDLHKIVDLAALLVRKNRLTDALTLLEQNAGQCEKQKVIYLRSNIWNLLMTTVDVAVAAKETKNESKMLLNQLIEMGYTKANLVHFGPVITEHLQKGQITAAIDEFERMVAEHEVAPQSLSLMIALIEMINATDNDPRWNRYGIDRPTATSLLRRVTDGLKKVSKPEMANAKLLTAFASAGNEDQLRKLLLNPALQFDVDELTKDLEHQVNTRKRIDILIKLAKCNRGLRHEAISEEKLYLMLLNRYTIDNNHAAAKEFYQMITRDAGYRMSRKLKQQFDDLFAKNDVTVSE